MPNFGKIKLRHAMKGRRLYFLPVLLLSAFLRSAEPVTPEGVKEWKKSWRVVEKVAGDFGLPGYEADKSALEAILQSDSPDKAVHHSDAYNAAYDPHYRIVRKDIFEQEVKPYLER